MVRAVRMPVETGEMGGFVKRMQLLFWPILALFTGCATMQSEQRVTRRIEREPFDHSFIFRSYPDGTMRSLYSDEAEELESRECPKDADGTYVAVYIPLRKHEQSNDGDNGFVRQFVRFCYPAAMLAK